ncbi:hypothetical protein J6590_090776 [Homalodisca vitripennis]|nr:hypothetical protein J6590_090776 [Homalodisca vitripennis]
MSDGVHMSFCTVAVDLQHADHGAPMFLADHYEVSEISVTPGAERVLAVDLQHADHGAPMFLADHYEVSEISVTPGAERVRERWGPYELLYSCRGPAAR